MRELTLPPRLAAIAALVPRNARLADIGTDHAYLPIHLLQTGRIKGAIACDLREGPLARGRGAAREWGVEEQISFRRCDGLAGLAPGEADVVAIAGMGGETMINILAEAPWLRNGDTRLLLQPMSGLPELRQWLFETGYRVERDVIVPEEKRFYVIVALQPGKDTSYTPAELEAGKQWQGMDAPIRAAYLDDLIRRRRRALEGMRRGALVAEAQLEAAADVLTGLEAMRKEWVAWQG